MADPPPPRVRVTGPRTRPTRRMTPASHIDARTGAGEIYMRSLIRSQLRLALTTTATLGLLVGSLPLALHSWPWLSTTRVAGIPLPWLLLGGGVYPVLIVLALLYVRGAERNESAFRALVEPAPEAVEQDPR